jgi:hypothetical protein
MNNYTIQSVNRETEDSIATTRAKHKLMRNLYYGIGGTAIGDQVVRWGQRQVDVEGKRLGTNKPDASYISAQGERVNIELDTDVNQSLAHSKKVNRDPNARNIYLIIHPTTGEVIGGRIREPGGGNERLLTPRELQDSRRGRGIIPRPRRWPPDPGATKRPRVRTIEEIKRIQTEAIRREAMRRRRLAARMRRPLFPTQGPRQASRRAWVAQQRQGPFSRARRLPAPYGRVRNREFEWESEEELWEMEASRGW